MYVYVFEPKTNFIYYRKRLQEGFYFAHYCAGICNMVLEVQMKVLYGDITSVNAVVLRFQELHFSV